MSDFSKDGVIVTDPTTGGRKEQKLARFDLIPVKPLWKTAEVYGVGCKKYAARNWELGYSWSLSFSSLMRHAWRFWAGESYDKCHPDCPPDCKQHTGCHHLAQAAWHCFTLMEFENTHPEKDDRVIDAEFRVNEPVKDEVDFSLMVHDALPEVTVDDMAVFLQLFRDIKSRGSK